MNSTKYNKLITAISLTAFSVLPIVLSAYVTGADPRLTGAPGDNPAACTQCHTGTRLNGGGGSVKIVMPGDAAYTPGVKQRIKVQVSDPAQRRWGFELTARPSGDPANAQAGDLSSADGNTQVLCADGRPKPCGNAGVLQFITHTLSGTRPGTAGSTSFAADGNNQVTGARNRHVEF